MPGGKKEQDRAWSMLGEFIRTQRQLARLSLRQLADMARVSNPYLSQIERGVYRPSAQVMKGIADALHISAESLYTQVGLLDEQVAADHGGVETAIQMDRRLSKEQKDTIIRVYRSFVAEPDVAAKPAGTKRKGQP